MTEALASESREQRRPEPEADADQAGPPCGAAAVTLSELIEAGVHYGHPPEKSHPAMESFLYGDCKGVAAIDLRQTLAGLEAAYTFVRDRAADGGRLLFVGTREPAREVVAEHARRCGMPHVINPNGQESAREVFDDGSTMAALDPASDAVLLVGLTTEEHSRQLARQHRLPIVALVDTDGDPESVDYGIAGNDDSRASCGLICRVMADAVDEGRIIAGRRQAEERERLIRKLALRLAERLEAERVEAERVEAERVEAERVEAERVEAERVEAEPSPRKQQRMARAAARQRASEQRRLERSEAQLKRGPPAQIRERAIRVEEAPESATRVEEVVFEDLLADPVPLDEPPDLAPTSLDQPEIRVPPASESELPLQIERRHHGRGRTQRRRGRRRLAAIAGIALVGTAAALATRVVPGLLEEPAQVTVEIEPSGAPSLMVDAGTIDIGGLQQAAVDLGLPDAVRDDGAGHYLLTAPVTVLAGGRLELADVDLRLLSGPDRFVGIEARGGDVIFDDAHVTSWNEATKGPDDVVADGRAYVLARDGARMDVLGSTVEMLGYDAHERYGISWRTQGTGGRIDESRFAGNFYGAYMAEVEPMSVTDSVFERSILYGLDPHTNSRNFVITGNVFRDNGRHGAILAEGCAGGRITGNEAYGNQEHGIVVFAGSDASVVEGNLSHHNGAAGISVNRSAGVVVKDNDVWANDTGIAIHDQAEDATVEGNRVSGNRTDGILVSSEASSAAVSGNRIDHNTRAGVWITDGRVQVGPGNTISNNESGVRLADETPSTDVFDNLLEENFKDGVTLGTVPGLNVHSNRIIDNNAAFSVRTAGDAEPFLTTNTLADNRLGPERVREPDPA